MAIESVEVRVSCDECGEDCLLQLDDVDDYEFRQAIEAEGWEREGGRLGGRHLCAGCVEKRDREDEEGDDDGA